MNENNIPHMAGIRETARIFGLAEHFIRELAKSGKIICIRAGNRYLINVDRLAEFLNTHTEGTDPEDDIAENHGITPIPVKF